MDIEDLLGNALADAVADAKARSLVDPGTAIHLEQAESMAYMIAMTR